MLFTHMSDIDLEILCRKGALWQMYVLIQPRPGEGGWSSPRVAEGRDQMLPGALLAQGIINVATIFTCLLFPSLWYLDCNYRAQVLTKHYHRGNQCRYHMRLHADGTIFLQEGQTKARSRYFQHHTSIDDFLNSKTSHPKARSFGLGSIATRRAHEYF
jgi:hypothetical protein